MKSTWNGAISFGLVNIPIKLYSAIDSRTVGFKMLDKKHHMPIHYKKWCEECGKEIKWEDIVKGVELAKDEYFIISKEELEKIKPKSTDIIDIVSFVDAKQIDPIYFQSHYFIGPAKEGEKTYFLFREVLQSSAKMAIGSFVMHEKEHIALIEAYKEGLLLTTLNYEYEIRDIKKIEELKDPPKLRSEELELAKQLIGKLYNPHFEISHFKDNYMEELKKLLKKKSKGEVVIVKEKAKTLQKEKDLVEALKASLK